MSPHGKAQFSGGRILLAWRIIIDETVIPLWISWVGVVIPGGLALWAFVLWRREDRGA